MQLQRCSIFVSCLSVVAVAVGLCLTTATPARAQDPTPPPAPTATPAWLAAVPIGAGGEQLLIERRVSYDGLLIACCILLVGVLLFLYFALRVVKLWT